MMELRLKVQWPRWYPWTSLSGAASTKRCTSVLSFLTWAHYQSAIWLQMDMVILQAIAHERGKEQEEHYQSDNDA